LRTAVPGGVRWTILVGADREKPVEPLSPRVAGCHARGSGVTGQITFFALVRVRWGHPNGWLGAGGVWGQVGKRRIFPCPVLGPVESKPPGPSPQSVGPIPAQTPATRSPTLAGETMNAMLAPELGKTAAGGSPNTGWSADEFPNEAGGPARWPHSWPPFTRRESQMPFFREARN